MPAGTSSEIYEWIFWGIVVLWLLAALGLALTRR